MKIREPVVLIVEDEVNDQYLLKTAFKKINVGCPVHAVGDGQEAIDYLKGNGPFADRDQYPFPTFVTVDLKMPRMNGFELLAFLKKNPHLMVVPTIIFTSSADRNDVTNAFLLGANAYHVKPQTFEGTCEQLKIMHDYWASCEVPEIDAAGNLLATAGGGKLSENVPKPRPAETKIAA